ncbi:MAG: hypothetical protein ACLQAT_05210 [Candidatus Binataceae bacterium]
MLGEFEYLLYTDAVLVGEVTCGLGPYAFFNLVPGVGQPGRVRPAFALRVCLHVSFETPRMNREDAQRYHGGSMIDEIVALASLKCGVRLRAGAETRWFDAGNPKGRPIAWDDRPAPRLSLGSRSFLLADVAGKGSIMPVAEMSSFPSLQPEQAIALVRSARMYQDALWLAESEPNLSWLMLVAAVETAANAWRSESASAIDRLRESRPSLVAYLESTGLEQLCQRVANEFKDSIGSTKKFVDFLLAFLAPAPTRRPANWARVEWLPESFRRSFRTIYGHRSRALHDGIPFPAPMCMPPIALAEWDGAIAEKPTGLGMSFQGGVWPIESTPMLLHIFEYLARSAINGWWTSMLSAPS